MGFIIYLFFEIETKKMNIISMSDTYIESYVLFNFFSIGKKARKEVCI